MWIAPQASCRQHRQQLHASVTSASTWPQRTRTRWPITLRQEEHSMTQCMVRLAFRHTQRKQKIGAQMTMGCSLLPSVPVARQAAKQTTATSHGVSRSGAMSIHATATPVILQCQHSSETELVAVLFGTATPLVEAVILQCQHSSETERA